MESFPSGLEAHDFLAEVSRLERTSRFADTARNLFDEGPHLVATPELPWGDEIRRMSVHAYKRFIHGETWITGEGAREMERDIVRFMGNMLGNPGITGVCTAGGSESNMCAILTAKERAGRRGSVVYPASGHYSLAKLCRMFDLEPIVVPPVAGSHYEVDPDALLAAIRPDTIAVILTAGVWAYGSVDPIAAVGPALHERGVYLHVDGAFGGYILPFLERSGYDAAMPGWDFRVPGVCSISADLHKNGMAPPPASTLFFRDDELLAYAKAICPPNGTISGTRGTGPIAGAWTMVKLLGEAGYTAVSRKSMALRDALVAGVERIDGVQVYPGSRINMALLHSDERDLRPVVDSLRAQGWMFSSPPAPPPVSIVAVAMPQNEGVIDDFLGDLDDAVRCAPSWSAGDPAGDAAVSRYGF